MTSADGPSPEEPVVIRDKRRVDVDAEQAAAPEGAAAGSDEALAALQTQLDERTADLQRLQAEFANYRKRVERDRLLLAEQAVGGVLATLLPVIDDVDRARNHGDLSGAFKAVADQLDATLAKLGLVAFGEPGDPFDPAVHEAVMHDESDSVSVPTTTAVMRKGYKHAERLLRPAMVGVTDPSTPAQPANAAPPADDAQTEPAGPAAAGTDQSAEA